MSASKIGSKVHDGLYKDTFLPVDQKVHKEICDAVLGAFEKT